MTPLTDALCHRRPQSDHHGAHERLYGVTMTSAACRVCLVDLEGAVKLRGELTLARPFFDRAQVKYNVSDKKRR